ncbi:MAG: protein translocase subunit SecDF [Flavobacteriales bacterium]|jgi:SecD/SecF fusion protein|nr:MAG: protein translocase subunit SecDF [Flavobacteriales bacterium]
MQNRGALWIFTVLLALACAYQLSFSYFTSRLEGKARAAAELQADSVLATPDGASQDRGSLVLDFENAYLRAHAEERVYPVLGYTYRECKEKEINLGLDLKGGMAVTLEVSIPELIENLSENSSDPAFTTALANARKRQLTDNLDFVTLFGQEYAKIENRPPLSAIFYSPDRQGMFDREGSDDDYLDALRREADAALSNTERILRTRIDKFGVSQPGIQKQAFSGRISIELPGVKDKERVRKVLQSTANLEFWETHDNTEIGPLLSGVNEPLSKLLYPELAASDTAAADTLAAAADTLATDTAAMAADTTGADTLAADTSSAPVDSAALRADQEKRAPLASKLELIIGQRGWMRGPVVGRANVKDVEAVNKLLAMAPVQSALPRDVRLAWAAKPMDVTFTNGESGQILDLYALKVPMDGKPKLDGSAITSASQDFDFKGEVEVRMSMNPEGAQTWKVMTGDNVGKFIAIVLDGQVYSAPEVRGEIAGGQSQISMGSGNLNEQIQEAEDLANILKAGALPAPARIIDETVVGPSLGQENVSTGLFSFLVALLLVMVYMALYYARAGWVADLALVVNLFVLIGSLASLQAALTLPGIAGIVLTMGMAVDANVLIYERIREELRHGKMLKSAVDLGYKGALSAIVDGNVTTLIIAVILLIFGSGPIQGFAVTLGLGILTSLFTALLLSRMIITYRLEKGKPFTVWMGWSKDIFVNAKYDFMGKRKVFYAISGTLIAIGIGSMAVNGFNWGVDFSGGRTYVVKFEGDVDVEKVRAALDDRFIGEDGVKSTPNVKTYGSDRQLKITTNFLINQPDTAADSRVESSLREGLAAVGTGYEITESRKVDPTISDDIKTGAITSLTIALALIFLYIAVRFRNWQFGLGGVLSLAHDALIVLGIYSLLYKVMPFSLEIDEAFIAAILTVIGYSINDTVIVYDRIREYLRDHKREAYPVVINKAINSTLGRTMNTSLTTLLVLVIIFIFGGVAIKGFVFALLVGIGVGTYSSIFVASSIVTDLLKGKDPAREA